jgi:hypothetical protein
MTLIPALRDALSDPDPHKSQARVHDLVAARIDALTPLSRVTKTDYFNHAWAPDLILTRGDEPERAVFLRFGVKDASFADDLDHLGRSAPIFLDLEAANPSPPPEEITHGEFDLQEALKSVGGGEAMVTDVPAIDRLDDLIRDDREARTATQQVVVGGRGLVDESAAHAIGVGWTVASGAASDADATQLRVALDQVEAYLSRIASLDLETALRGAGSLPDNRPRTFRGARTGTCTTERRGRSRDWFWPFSIARMLRTRSAGAISLTQSVQAISATSSIASASTARARP